MKKKIITGLAAIYTATAIGCAATKPNSSMLQANLGETSIENILLLYHSNPATNYKQAATALVSQISIHNPLLALELGKLPEFQDGVSEQETKALEELVNLYEQMPQKFDSAFKQMYQVGKPDFRKYNSPLQAMFWLFEDDKAKIAMDVLNNYTLNNLLDKTWPKQRLIYIEKWKLRLEEANKVEKSCNDKALRKKIEDFKKKNGQNTDYAITISRQNPEKFSYHFSQTNIDTKIEKQYSRWKNFSEVIDRLNSPLLVYWYLQNNYSYDPYLGFRKSVKSVFNDKSANCADWSKFVQYTLDKAGYNVLLKEVGTEDTNHIFAYYKEDGFFIVLDQSWQKGSKVQKLKSLRLLPYDF